MEVEEIEYYSGAPCDDTVSIIYIPPLSVPHFPAIPNLINGQLASAWVSFRLQNLQSQWLILLGLHKSGCFQECQFVLESVLVSMKRVVDDLVMGAYCIHKEDEVTITRRVKVDGWGGLFNKGAPTQVGSEIIDKFIGEYDDFPIVLNDLVNALKHSFLMPEARLEWNNYFPLVRAIYAPFNDYSNKVVIHNHDMRQLVLGFNKFVKQLVIKTHPHSAGGVMPLPF